MKVKELMKELEKANPDAPVILTVGDDDQDFYSSSEFEIHGDGIEYIDLFMHENAPQQL